MNFTSIKAGIIAGIAVLSSWLGSGSPVQAPVQPAPVAVEQNTGAYNITGGGTYRLKASVGTSDTSVSLSSFKEPVSDQKYSMTYLNTTVAYGTIDPQTTRPEFISFSGITQNSDGSATLTGVTRGLTRTPAGLGCTASTTLAQRHPGQSIFILSDSPCHFAEYAVKRNDETITGTWLVPTPTAGTQVVNKNYVDGLVNGGTVSTDRVRVVATAGENFSAGSIVYYDIYQGKWYKAKADVASTTENVLIGIAQAAGSTGLQISGGVNIRGIDDTQVGMSTGQKLYLSSATAGATSTSPGTNWLALGAARSSTSFYLDPSMDRSVRTNSTSTNATTTNLSVSGTCVGCNNIPITATTSLAIGDAVFSNTISGSTGFATSSNISNDYETVGQSGGQPTRLAQSFTNTTCGTINTISFDIRKHGSPTGLLQFAVYKHDGTTPTGSPLASGYIDGSTLTTSFASTTVQLNNTLVLNDSSKFALVVQTIADASNGSAWWEVLVSTTDVNPDGKENRYESGWLNDSTARDFAFRCGFTGTGILQGGNVYQRSFLGFATQATATGTANYITTAGMPTIFSNLVNGLQYASSTPGKLGITNVNSTYDYPLCVAASSTTCRIK